MIIVVMCYKYKVGFWFVGTPLLWLAIALTIFLFLKISRPAALLLLPYLLWVSYASALNISIYFLNR